MQIKSKALLAATALAFPTLAWGQTVPNYGNYESLHDNYRIGIRLANGTVIREASYQQRTITDIIDYLDPFELAAAQPGFYNQLTSVTAVFDLMGSPVIGSYNQNNPTLTIRFINPHTGTTLIGKDGLACAFQYNGATRQQSFNALDVDSDEEINPDSRILGCAARAQALYSPVNPLVGNPNSLQASLTRGALDFTEGDSLVELGGNANSAGDPWLIGASYTFGSAGRFDISRIDARINKGWRVFEGNRARLKFDMPLSYTTIQGAKAFTGQIAMGLEVPVVENAWSLEPRVAYGITVSADQGSIGHIAQGTIASRYVVNGLGRGKLMIGNMVGYSGTLDAPGGYNINPGVKAWMFRNGVSYETPLGMRIGGNSTSMRASYSFTNYEGAELFNNNFHEGTLSFGLRGREDTPKAFRDTVRLNLSTVQATNYSTYSIGIGFRF